MNRRIAKKVLRNDIRDANNWAHGHPRYGLGQLMRAMIILRRTHEWGKWSPLRPWQRRLVREGWTSFGETQGTGP